MMRTQAALGAGQTKAQPFRRSRLGAEAAQLLKTKAFGEKERDGRSMRGIKVQQIDEKRHPAECREHLAGETPTPLHRRE